MSDRGNRAGSIISVLLLIFGVVVYPLFIMLFFKMQKTKLLEEKY
jgi:hypothetical protein